MSAPILYLADLIAVTVLAAGVYWPRHRRRDLVVAFFGINVGVLAVSALLANSAVTAGLGLGLFGVLSIIRLRSDELAQHEIAYYFATLALGLVGGLGITPIWMSLAFMALILVTMGIVDHPAIMARSRRQLIVLDRAIGDEDLLREHLEQMLGAEVTAVSLQKLDLVTDTTTVDVRYRVPRAGSRDPRAEQPTAAPGPAPTPAPAPAPAESEMSTATAASATAASAQVPAAHSPSTSTSPAPGSMPASAGAMAAAPVASLSGAAR
ncbi:hypothetical protein BF93_14955 [Brachybacterium phenoliresistens]|uniref:Permease n=1 Tax=Brachybacterium phenoliresistens TaxID=396014 RepID=Z9JVH9_9MICO|nr:hypothetical protein BF93_14955 [Brachybacterium phenoliresistens]